MPSVNDLIAKYNVPVPRYTSYPTVPDWDVHSFTPENYLHELRAGFTRANAEGMALYIHLPYCESLCTYCGCNTRISVNHAVEKPYIDAVLAEWNLYLSHFTEKPLIREIHLGGGTPTFFSPENLLRLIEGLLAGSRKAPEASFSFEAHPANTTPDHLRLLAWAGFDRISLGIQDFDLTVQKAIHRIQSAEDVRRVVEWARSYGYRSVNFDLIYGLPFQSLQSINDTIDRVAELLPDRIAYYSYAHVPWMKPGQRAYSEADLPDPQEKLGLFISGRDKLLDAGYMGIGFDHFALPEDALYQAYTSGTLHRNFMGYTERRTGFLIGLGASAISDLGCAFAQNAKAVEPYMESVAQGCLPIIKGHILTGDEIFLRKHILNLTCRQRTSWAYAPLHEMQYMRSRLGALGELRADGLVETGLDHITLTDRGRIFSRNVCSVFDMHYKTLVLADKYSRAV